MTVRRSKSDEFQKAFDRLPATHARHLAFLWAGKAGYAAAARAGNDGVYEWPMGCWDAADAALELTGVEPKVLVDGGRSLKFNRKLFKPLPTDKLDPLAAAVYVSALATVGVQLRMLAGHL